MRVPRFQFTIRRLMIVIAIAAVIFAMAAWVSWDSIVLLVTGLTFAVIFSPIVLQLIAIFWRDERP